MSKTYAELRKINVNEHIEKKNGLSYLSWSWALDQLLQLDENATWRYDEPVLFGSTMMVFCTVTAFGRSRTAQLPVMDYRNKAILNPDAFAVNTAMQRCLAKAISLHGIGLYIYSGEDLPAESAEQEPAEKKQPERKLSAFTPEELAEEIAIAPVIQGKEPKIYSKADLTKRGWVITVTTDSGADKKAWLEEIKTAVTSFLVFCDKEDDVMGLFTKNKQLFDTVKQIDAEFFKNMMSSFTERKNQIKEKTNG